MVSSNDTTKWSQSSPLNGISILRDNVTILVRDTDTAFESVVIISKGRILANIAATAHYLFASATTLKSVIDLSFQTVISSTTFVQPEQSEAVEIINPATSSASRTDLSESAYFEDSATSSAASPPLPVSTTMQSQLYKFYRTEKCLTRKEISRTLKVKNKSIPDAGPVLLEDLNVKLGTTNEFGPVKKLNPKSMKKKRKRNQDYEEDSYSDSDYIDDDSFHDFGPRSNASANFESDSHSDSGSDKDYESNSVTSSHTEKSIGKNDNNNKHKSVGKTLDSNTEDAAAKDSDEIVSQKSKKKKKQHPCTHLNCSRVFSKVRAYEYRLNACISINVLSSQ